MTTGEFVQLLIFVGAFLLPIITVLNVVKPKQDDEHL